jgi:hypothetical protein
MRRSSVLTLLSVATILSCSRTGASDRPDRTEEERAVLMAVQRFFDTMTSKNAAGARQVLDPEGDFVSVRWNSDGGRVVRRAPNSAYLRGLETETATYLERMWDSEVRVHGPIAIVWTPYDFHIDGKFSHCGIDAFQLLRTETGWTVTGGTYTVERTGCPESPLGAPGS